MGSTATSPAAVTAEITVTRRAARAINTPAIVGDRSCAGALGLATVATLLCSLPYAAQAASEDRARFARGPWRSTQCIGMGIGHALWARHHRAATGTAYCSRGTGPPHFAAADLLMTVIDAKAHSGCD